MTPAAEPVSHAILTVPNVISGVRLLGVPLFAWLVVGVQADGWAVALLALAGATDWVDGYVARRTGQVTRLGQLLDPLADRLYTAVTILALAWRGIVPWWLVVLLLGRDLVLAVVLAVLRRRGGPTGLPVHYLGKAATLCLLFAFPLLLLGDGQVLGEQSTAVAKAVGWAFALWGTALYLWAGVLYVEQARRWMRAHPGAAPVLRAADR